MFYRNMNNLQCDLQRGHSAGREFFVLFRLTYFFTFIQQRSKHTSNCGLRISVTCVMTCWKCHSRQKIARQVLLDFNNFRKAVTATPLQISETRKLWHGSELESLGCPWFNVGSIRIGSLSRHVSLCEIFLQALRLSPDSIIPTTLYTISLSVTDGYVL